MEFHQRSGVGNSVINEMFSRYFRLPEGFENTLYLSQVQQAWAIKFGVEYWRSLRPYCMGTIYWQLNDNWPVASWSSLDFGGKWKLLHYAAKRFYAPLIVTCAQKSEDDFSLCIVNDSPEDRDATVTADILSFEGEVLKRLTFNETAKAEAVTGILQTTLKELLTCKPHEAFMHVRVDFGADSIENTHYFARPKRSPLADADVCAQTERQVSGQFTVTLKTDKPAHFVTINARKIKGEFDDNMITLIPDQPRQLVFIPKEPVDIDKFKTSLEIFHLRNTFM